VAPEPHGAYNASLLMCPNHTQFDIPGGVLLNEWSARRRGSYLHNTLYTRSTRDV